MAESVQLKIVTPTRLLFDERVHEITAPGALGEFGVLPNHITFLTSLEIGTLHYRMDGEAQRIAIRGGFAEVISNVMTILAEDAAFPEDINLEVARADLAAAEAQLRDLSPLDPHFAATEANRRWAQERLDVGTGR